MTLPITVTQAELHEISDLEREVAWKQHHLEALKSNLLVLLKEGAQIEQGRFDARLVTRAGRNVPWKQEFVDRLGQDTADAVKREYKTHVWYEVEVMEHAVPPLWRDGTEGTESFGTEN